MELLLRRTISTKNETGGQLYGDGGELLCFTLEDEYRPNGEKVYGETRIPAGRYEIKLRAEGTTNARYQARYTKEWHPGTLHLQDVPGFSYILIHIGNSDADTLGCILVGDCHNWGNERLTLANSTVAYRRIYEPIRDWLLSGKQVFIKIEDC
jgi:hypothetical protein